MAKIAVALMIALFASVTLAQSTCPTGTALFQKPAGCAGYATCEATLCGCAGVTGTSADTCLRNVSSTFGCASLTLCFTNFVKCLSTLANTARTNTTGACGMWAVTLHTSVLSAAGTTFTGSALQKACAQQACILRNTSSTAALRTCDMGGVNFTTVCSYDNIVLPGTTTAAPRSISGASTISMAAVAVLAVVAALL